MTRAKSLWTRVPSFDSAEPITTPLIPLYSIVRSIVEYASPVWAAIPLYLDELIDSVQRKALKIIFGRVDYTEALVLAGLESLSDRRVGACKRFMATARQMSPLKKHHPLSCRYLVSLQYKGPTSKTPTWSYQKN